MTKERAALFITAHRVVAGATLVFRYQNWRDEVSVRTVKVLEFVWGSTEWHTEEQMLMLALDLEKDEERAFAVAGIQEVLALS